MAIFAPIFSSWTYEENTGLYNTAPSTEHWFGTDDIARDLFVRVWQGARISLFIGLAAAVIDLIIVIGMALGGPTGYAINPARDLGPRIAHAVLPIPGKGDSAWWYAWVPVVAPIIGGVYGAAFYSFIWNGEHAPLFWSFSAIVVVIFALAQTTVSKVEE